MSGFKEEAINDLMSPWAPPLSPSISTLYDQIENGQRFNPSTLLQTQISRVPVTNSRPLEITEGSGEDHATIIVSNNNVTDHQPMNVHDQPLQQDGSDNVISRETHVEYDQNIVSANILDVGESSTNLKRSMECVEGSNIAAIRFKSQDRIIIQMETEENNPDDGFRWRKYGGKPLKGNSNPRSYYKCTFDGCKVRKLVERGAGDIKLLVVTYDGKHEHAAPAPGRSKKSDIDQTHHELVTPASSSLPLMDTRPALVNQNLVLTSHYDHLVNQNLSSMHQPVNHNLVSIHQNNQLVNQNLDFVHQIDQPVNNNWSSMHQPINHNMARMHQNDQLLNMNYELNNEIKPKKKKLNNENPSFVYQNDQI